MHDPIDLKGLVSGDVGRQCAGDFLELHRRSDDFFGWFRPVRGADIGPLSRKILGDGPVAALVLSTLARSHRFAPHDPAGSAERLRRGAYW
jgi:hypothetical protein